MHYPLAFPLGHITTSKTLLYALWDVLHPMAAMRSQLAFHLACGRYVFRALSFCAMKKVFSIFAMQKKLVT